MNILKCFPSKYVKAVDLSGREVTVQIARLQIEEVGTPPDSEQKPVLYFINATKGLILNKTLALTIAALYGNETDDWSGKWLILYPTQVRAFGKVHDVIRIRPTLPPKATKPTSPSQPPESQLDDLDDLIDADEVDAGVPFAEKGCGLRGPAGSPSTDDDDPGALWAPIQEDDTDPIQPDSAAWQSPLEAQAWAVKAGLTADAKAAQKVWTEAVRACAGFDRTKAPLVYARYVELLRERAVSSTTADCGLRTADCGPEQAVSEQPAAGSHYRLLR